MTPRDQWLTQIRSNPSDWQSMLVFADWLEDDGDLLAAEQWRWMAAVSGSLASVGKVVPLLTRRWPGYNTKSSALFDTEKQFAIKHNIRCMPTYPMTIEDAERYYEIAHS